MESSRQPRLVVRRKLLVNTYITASVMLVIGAMQFAIMSSFQAVARFYEAHFYCFMIQYFVSLFSLQLYVFFFHIMGEKHKMKRHIFGIWTYEINTVAVMKSINRSPNMCFYSCMLFLFVLMGASAAYGHMAVSHKRGPFLQRKELIRVSVICYAFSTFLMITLPHMKKRYIALGGIFLAVVVLSIFIIFFTSSIFKPNVFYFYQNYDYMIIGHLFYLQLYTLYAGCAMTLGKISELFNWNF